MILLTSRLVAIGGTFGFIRSASANLREKDDHWNPTIAGFFAGAVGGLRCKDLCDVWLVLSMLTAS